MNIFYLLNFVIYISVQTHVFLFIIILIDQISWLNNYYSTIRSKVGPILRKHELAYEFMMNATEPFVYCNNDSTAKNNSVQPTNSALVALFVTRTFIALTIGAQLGVIHLVSALY